MGKGNGGVEDESCDLVRGETSSRHCIDSHDVVLV